jgi:hypothetical protein
MPPNSALTDGMLANDASGFGWHACSHLEGAQIVRAKLLIVYSAG